MYTAVLTASLAVVWAAPTFLSVGAFCVVIIVLICKLRIEERALRKRFPEYDEYAKTVPALMPFLPGRLRGISSSHQNPEPKFRQIPASREEN